MVLEIKTLLKDNEEKHINIRKTELQALYAQVNPHFIYNTLDSIKWIALMNKQEHISNLILAFTTLLKNTLFKSGEYVKIKHELDNITSYAAIMKVRYDNFAIEYHVSDETIYDYRIINFLLQPLIENAIIHGFDGINYLARINIYFYLESGKLHIDIADNGIGIPQHIVQSLFADKPRENTADKFNSIGINNIKRRIELNHGPGYGLKILPNQPHGTIVRIILPILGNDNDRKDKVG